MAHTAEPVGAVSKNHDFGLMQTHFFSFFWVICGKTVHRSQFSKVIQQLMTTQHYSVVPLNYMKKQTNPSNVVPADKILSKVCLWRKERKGWGVNLR